MKLTQFSTIDPNVVFLGADLECEIQGLCALENPTPHTLCLVKEVKYLKRLLAELATHPGDYRQTRLLLERNFYENELAKKRPSELELLHSSFAGVVLVSKLDAAIPLLSQQLYTEKMGAIDWISDGRARSGTIGPDCRIAEDVFIGDHVTIGAAVTIMAGAKIHAHSKIGDNSVIFNNSVLYPYTQIGKFCRIHAGTIIGADGFGYNFVGGAHQKIWHIGGVIIEDSVEIGANSAVDAGTFTPTLIGAGTKIDNFVQIGHNCQLGKGVILCGHVAIGGSTKIGNFTVFGGKAGCGHGLTIGDQCQIAGGALVNCDWPAKSVLGGHPARELGEWMRSVATLRKFASSPRKE